MTDRGETPVSTLGARFCAKQAEGAAANTADKAVWDSIGYLAEAVRALADVVDQLQERNQ